MGGAILKGGSSAVVLLRGFEEGDQGAVLAFLEECLPQSGRTWDPAGRHRLYGSIGASFDDFWCLLDGGNVVGTAALKKLDGAKCELKALYLLQAYHGRGLGCRLLETAILRARETGYKEMYLDTLSTSKRAIRLYEKMGFTRTKRYNGNEAADVFMVLKLDNWE
ncbi:GNAT family N-acetyltransferase [uncultured Intestinimonas sp.]|uniref:GNAT family N-acetyltransferase n=1 Tax=uncultured Intestinimonas sp. TaxID=1689265 RepID=UPI0025D7DB86|nr:GNAT family N-acetyltransferase [uncultured Intestinimonas sp.]